MTFESTIVPNNWRSDMIPHCTRVKGERNECRNHRGISLLSVVGKISAGILVGIVRRVTEGLIKDEQGGFKSGSKLVRNRRRKSERELGLVGGNHSSDGKFSSLKNDTSKVLQGSIH